MVLHLKTGENLPIIISIKVLHLQIIVALRYHYSAFVVPHSIDIPILQDDDIFKSEIEYSIPGMDHYLKSAPKRRTLFLPEHCVDVISSAEGSLDITKQQEQYQKLQVKAAVKYSDPPHNGVLMLKLRSSYSA